MMIGGSKARMSTKTSSWRVCPAAKAFLHLSFIPWGVRVSEGGGGGRASELFTIIKAGRVGP